MWPAQWSSKCVPQIPLGVTRNFGWYILLQIKENIQITVVKINFSYEVWRKNITRKIIILCITHVRVSDSPAIFLLKRSVCGDSSPQGILCPEKKCLRTTGLAAQHEVGLADRQSDWLTDCRSYDPDPDP